LTSDVWAMTSGAAGEFVGSHDWSFESGWQERLSTASLAPIIRLRELFSQLPWWRLVPDTDSRLVTGGRGTLLNTDVREDVLQSDYVTAAWTPGGNLSVIYLPTQHTITINPAMTGAETHAEWLDPASGSTRPVTMSTTFTPPGKNADGGNDWPLILRSGSVLMSAVSGRPVESRACRCCHGRRGHVLRTGRAMRSFSCRRPQPARRIWRTPTARPMRPPRHGGDSRRAGAPQPDRHRREPVGRCGAPGRPVSRAEV
jgi:hypothetical protein